MCDYTHVQFRCHHVRYVVRAWCTNYESTHRRCPPAIVAMEYRLEEKCGDCRAPKEPPSWLARQKNSSAHRIRT